LEKNDFKERCCLSVAHVTRFVALKKSADRMGLCGSYSVLFKVRPRPELACVQLLAMGARCSCGRLWMFRFSKND